MTATIDAEYRKKRRIRLLIFLLCVFALISAWALVQPYNVSPDEDLRYKIVQYLVKHGTLPNGFDAEIRSELWGVSYGFYPILGYMIMAIPAKIVSLFTSDFQAVLIAARLVNAAFGTGMAFFVFRIGELLMDDNERRLFCCLVCFLPGILFLHSYVNTDSLALFSTAWIIYAWARSIKEGWTVPVCLHLAIGVGLCALSYYNAYGAILCSILFFHLSILLCQEKRDWSLYRKRLLLIVAVVLLIAGWWFVRNAILYEGDFFGRNAATQCGMLYGLDEYKLGTRLTPEKMGMTIPEMLFGPAAVCNWLVTVAVSFVGTFGYMEVFMPYGWTCAYFVLFLIGFIGCVCLIPKLLALWDKDQKMPEEPGKPPRRVWKAEGVFHWMLLGCIFIPIYLLIQYSYYSDYQVQGRYLMPAAIPFFFFIAKGILFLAGKIFKTEKSRKIFTWILCGALIASSIGVYLLVFLPQYC